MTKLKFKARKITGRFFSLLSFKCSIIPNFYQNISISPCSSWKTALPSTGELTALAFPPTCIALSCSHVQLVSSCVDRIKVTWTPRDLWTAEQSIHRNTPYVTLAHVGLLLLQSKHVWKRPLSTIYLSFTLQRTWRNYWNHRKNFE